MYKQTLKVFGEDLYNAGTAGVVNVGGSMGALAINLVAIADDASFAATTVTVKQGDEASSVTEACGEFASVEKANVKAGEVIATYTLPADVKTFVTASVSGETTNARVTVAYLPR